MNLTKPFNGGLGKYMRKAARPSGSVDSSNPHRWGDGRLHYNGCGVYWIGCVLWIWSCDPTSSSYVKNGKKILLFEVKGVT